MAPSAPKQRSTVRRALRWVVLGAVLLQGALWLYPEAIAGAAREVLDALEDLAPVGGAAGEGLCVQEDALTPTKNGQLWKQLGVTFGTDEFRGKAIEWLGGAVRIPTETYHRMAPIGEDPRWEAFGLFHDYLLKAFPLVHSTLTLTKVNRYGLVYEWTGANALLKPLLLMAHQDVVPVDPTTVDKWAHPPYAGHYDGKRIWGRGSSDDKSGLIGILSTLETLIENGFIPARGIVLSFGCDEETNGDSAKANANALLAKYGENSFEMIVDEGGGFGEQYGGTFAVPSVTEKGYLDVRVEVHTPGGHSSVPPPHTSIGMLSQFIVQYESHPHVPKLTRGTPVYKTVQCLAAHAPGLPPSLRKAIKKSVTSGKALKLAEKQLFEVPAFRALGGTTQAVDLVQGGVKSNALPEEAWALVSRRIGTESSVGSIMEHDTALLKDLAARFNLSYTAFGTLVSAPGAPASGTLEISDAWDSPLEPAPITPMDGKPYALLAGTIRATYAAHRRADPRADENFFVAPGIMTGNTDTHFYWALSEHIFRYNHHNQGKDKALSGAHTVNESITVDSFLGMILFFNTLILNVDEAQF